MKYTITFFQKRSKKQFTSLGNRMQNTNNNAKIYYSELEKYFHIYEIHSDRKVYK